MRELLDFLAEAPRTMSVVPFRAALLHRLEAVVHADLLVWNEFNLTEGSAFGADEPAGTISDELRPAFERHMAGHPLVRHFVATGDYAALRLSDVASRAAFHRLPIYDEFFRPLGVEYQLVCGASPSPGQLIGLSFNRADRDFTDAQCILVELLRPHVIAANALVERADALATLTVREREVLHLVHTGATNREIGGLLVIAPSTVKKHLEHVFVKLGVQTRTAAAARLALPPGTSGVFTSMTAGSGDPVGGGSRRAMRPATLAGARAATVGRRRSRAGPRSLRELVG
ncbi:MAG: hypothetical protein NVS1B9_02380 [Solirubrobacteraceae bacterium]